ncbi:MAG: hypothetical protein HFF54_01430 [Lawsonibacter sp.]|nr:hypothetical protein [Lawsonibacter sp.]
MKNVKDRRKRIFGASILLMMLVLALGTAAMAATGTWDEKGSYSLIIQKQFDKDTPEGVLEEAMKQTYRFHIQGYRLDADKNKIEIDEYVEIGPKSDNWEGTAEDGAIRWKLSEKFCSNGPIHVSVTEITNDITLEVDGKEYNMGASRVEASDLYQESPQVRDLNNNGKIVLSRPEKKTIFVGGQPSEVPVTTTSSFRIRSEWPWDEGTVAKPPNWEAYDKTVTLAPGDSHSWDKLMAGRYTIEDLSVSGYNIQLGARDQEVKAGETGTFYINNNPGKLVITAGGTPDDGAVHYYELERVWTPGDADPFTKRFTDVGVKSGEQYTFDALPKGEYEVKEFSIYVPTAFKVTVPHTASAPKTLKFQKKYFGEAAARYISFDVGGDYITDLKFGRLFDASDKGLSSKDTYDFGIRYRKTADQEGQTTSTWKAPRLANKKYSFTSPIYPRTSGTLAFSCWNVSNASGEYLALEWVENTRTEPSSTKDDANVNYSCTVDDRGWIEITAPKVDLTKPGAENVTYTYEVRKNKTDETALKSLTLDPGETGTIAGLEEGTYFLMEKVDTGVAEFKMEISGDPFGSTEAGKEFDLTVMDTRQLTIRKPENEQDGGRSYTFKVEKISGDTEFETKTVTLKAGESSDISLPAGRYLVTPTDDMTEVFQMVCSDSSQVHSNVPSGSSATVTFTNVFTEGTLGYRYVHEYYIKDENGKYHYEGCSPVTTVGGRTDTSERYGSIDIAKEPFFTFEQNGEKKTYAYMYIPDQNAYGYVGDALKPESDAGFRSSNQSKDKRTGEEISYYADETLTADRMIGVDKDKSQIIVLRYFRVLEEHQKGHYKYVHVYYRRDADGKRHWEGTSAIGDKVGQLGMPYSADNVDLVPNYKPADSDETYRYVHDGRPNYGILSEVHTDPFIEEEIVSKDPSNPNHHHYRPNSEADHILATEDGQQIIVLRYYRDAATTGTYKVVHEYYFREKLEEGSGDVSGGTEEEDESRAAPQSTDGALPQDGDGTEEVPETGGSSFSGTLSGDGRYAYTFEGAREIQTISAPLNSPHDEKEVEQQTKWKPDGVQNMLEYTYKDAVYGNTSGSGYHSVSGMQWAASTEEGNEIIILRYFREGEPDEPEKPKPEPPGGGGTEEPDPEGSYKVVHEYYLQDSSGKKVLEGVSEIGKRTGKLDRRYDKSDVREVPNFEGQRYTYTDYGCGVVQSKDAYTAQEGKTYVTATQSGDQIIILRYVRKVEELPKGAYKVVHEYYYRSEDGDVLEGVTDVETVDGLVLDGTQYTEADVARRYEFGGREYVYLESACGTSGSGSYQPDPDMAFVVATEEGQEIIILRYIREEETKKPEEPPKPEVPEVPEEPQLPDPNDPDSPETVTVEEDGVPKTYVKVWDPEEEEWVYIPEDEVPLADQSPKTGDGSRTALWAALAAGSLCGLAMLLPAPQKRKDQ